MHITSYSSLETIASTYLGQNLAGYDLDIH